MPKNNLQGIASRDIYIYQRGHKLNNITSEGNYDNILLKNNTNGNFIIKNNLYELKNKHFRNNTASFDNKDILNIFNSKALSNKSTKNINNLNINDLHNIGVKSNNYNNICINNIDANNKNSNLDSNLNLYINKNNLNNESMAPSSQIINKANKTGKEITEEMLEKACKKNLRLNVFNWGIGFAISATFLSTIIPKVQYWITKKYTGENEFPGTAEFRNKKA
jgi:hypothetical protein